MFSIGVAFLAVLLISLATKGCPHHEYVVSFFALIWLIFASVSLWNTLQKLYEGSFDPTSALVFLGVALFVVTITLSPYFQVNDVATLLCFAALILAVSFFLYTAYFPVLLYVFALAGLVTNTLPPPLCLGLVFGMILIIVMETLRKSKMTEDAILKQFGWEAHYDPSGIYYTRGNALLYVEPGVSRAYNGNYQVVTHMPITPEVLVNVHNILFIQSLQNDVQSDHLEEGNV